MPATPPSPFPHNQKHTNNSSSGQGYTLTSPPNRNIQSEHLTGISNRNIQSDHAIGTSNRNIQPENPTGTSNWNIQPQHTHTHTCNVLSPLCCDMHPSTSRNPPSLSSLVFSKSLPEMFRNKDKAVRHTIASRGKLTIAPLTSSNPPFSTICDCHGRRRGWQGGRSKLARTQLDSALWLVGVSALFFFCFCVTFTFQLLDKLLFRCRPFPPPVRAFSFHRAWGSAFTAFPLLVDFHRMLLTDALALSRGSILCTRKVPTNLYNYALGGTRTHAIDL